MRLTEAQIRRIIKEELMNVLEIQDVSVGKKSFLSQNEKQPEVLATFKVKDILSIFAAPKSDADIDKLKPLRDFLFNFRNYSNQLSADQKQLLLKKEANIVKKGSGNIYQYWMVMPHITEEGFKEVPIGKEAELAAFENLTGIKLNKQINPQSSTVTEPSSRVLPSRGAEMSAFANQLQGGTHGLAKGMRENKRK
jgi:hypothetical protein